MASSIDVAFIKQYSATLMRLSQQRGSRFKPFVRNEQQASDSQFFDRLGPTVAVQKASRHSDTPLIESDHTRRMVTLVDYEWATLLDKQDEIRLLIDPASQFLMNASDALGRAMDDVVINAALGNAYGGNNGATAVALPSTQFLGAVSSGALSRLNVSTLRKLRKQFSKNEVDPSSPLHIMVDAEQIENLLGETEVGSADYNTVKALVDGQVDTFMGFKFHHSERLLTSGLFTIATDTGAVTLSTGNGNGSRQCIAWSEQGLLLSTGLALNGRIDERADKSYATQVYASLSIGATRMEEAQVMGVLCKSTI